MSIDWSCSPTVHDGAVAICAEERLRYSIETWTHQLQDFVEQVIQQPVYLAGNSLGGLLSAHLAATQPHLCRSAALLERLL